MNQFINWLTWLDRLDQANEGVSNRKGLHTSSFCWNLASDKRKLIWSLGNDNFHRIFWDYFSACDSIPSRFPMDLSSPFPSRPSLSWLWVSLTSFPDSILAAALSMFRPALLLITKSGSKKTIFTTSKRPISGYFSRILEYIGLANTKAFQNPCRGVRMLVMRTPQNDWYLKIEPIMKSMIGPIQQEMKEHTYRVDCTATDRDLLAVWACSRVCSSKYLLIVLSCFRTCRHIKIWVIVTMITYIWIHIKKNNWRYKPRDSRGNLSQGGVPGPVSHPGG